MQSPRARGLPKFTLTHTATLTLTMTPAMLPVQRGHHKRRSMLRSRCINHFDLLNLLTLFKLILMDLDEIKRQETQLNQETRTRTRNQNKSGDTNNQDLKEKSLTLLTNN